MERFEKSLAEISLDNTNKRLLCPYKNKFLSFDELKGLLQKKNLPESPDILFISDVREEVWFIETKSSSERNLQNLDKRVKLRKKLFAALFMLYEIYCEQSCKLKKYKKYYFVVYNKKTTTSFEDELLEVFSENSPRSIEFYLEDLKPQFVDDIFTENCDSFVELFSKRFNIHFKRTQK